MYIAKKTCQVGTRENTVVVLTQGKEIPKGMSAATIERWIERGVIEKISVKAEAQENKAIEASEVKSKPKKSKTAEE